MDYDIATHDVEPQAIVSIRERHARPDLAGFIKAGIPELFQRLGPLGIGPAGPPFVIYHEFGADRVDVEVCVPVARTIPAADRIQSRVLPRMTVARTTHVGRYETLGVTYAAVFEWIAANGYEVAGPSHERYLNGPGDGVSPSQYRTEVEMPVVPVGVVAAV
jgi:effector-binding domain-containing protein